MCRMVAVRSSGPAARERILGDLRGLADRSYTGSEHVRSHRSGWGIVGLSGARVAHLGRAPRDASQDPSFLEAVQRATRVSSDSIVVGHVRNASVGGRRAENTHPFVRDGWAFCHNGTVHGLQAPEGAQPEGETDSEAFFLHLLEAVRETRDVPAAVHKTATWIRARHRYSSLTFLLTDGKDLYGYREVGNMYGSCGTRECALEHYALGFGRLDEALVVAQEPEVHEGLTVWEALPNGGLLVARAGKDPLVVDLAKPALV